MDKEIREAVVSVFQIGIRSGVGESNPEFEDEWTEGGGESASFAVAIWFNREASKRRRSCVG